MLRIIIAAKVMIKSCRFARECMFIYESIDVTAQMELCFHEQTQVVANADCRMGSYVVISKLHIHTYR